MQQQNDKDYGMALDLRRSEALDAREISAELHHVRLSSDSKLRCWSISGLRPAV